MYGTPCMDRTLDTLSIRQDTHIFLCMTDLHRLKDCSIGQRVLSDHSGLYLTFHLEGRLPKTLWSYNTGMLNDPNLRSSMVSDLNIYLQHNDNREVNPSILWDAAKAGLRGKIVVRTAALKRVKAQKLSQLQEKLQTWNKCTLLTQNPVLYAKLEL